MAFVLCLLTEIGAAQQAPMEGEQEETEAPPVIPPLHQSIVITASPVEPTVDRRNAEVFRITLFSRDDQVFQLLDAGINAGQHEGGGKSVEVRRFGFNLDHGGVNGGLKVLVDNIQQNQTTQGHGQGYLGSLKSLSPELVDEVSIIHGPFSAEYGDFSGLGVVHIRLRESLADALTVRLQGGSYNTVRSFLGFSPQWRDHDFLMAYEGSATDGPFETPLGYRRDNVSGNLIFTQSAHTRYGFKWNAARNDFSSSGQLPLDEVFAGRLSPFGSLSPGDGGRSRSGTLGMYYRRESENGVVWKVDGFAARSLFDLYSNFTFFLDDPVNGDGIQQHDSRLQEGANVQYLRPFRNGLLTAGGNLHANQINVGLYPRVVRTPLRATTSADAEVTNGAGYAQVNRSWWHGRLQTGGGLRYDAFRFDVRDRLDSDLTGASTNGQWQPKANIAVTPSFRVPVTLHANYGRGISSLDARGVVRSSGDRHLATTDFYQVGAAHRMRRLSVVADLFWIARSNELVYVPDDGSLEFYGPSRAYGYETKVSVEITRKLSFDGGVTKVMNAFYRGTAPRQYVDRAPHLTANAGLTLSAWKGWSGSLRVRTINRYRLDPEDATIAAAGSTVVDFGLARRIRQGVDFNLSIDNLLDRSYWETQNYFESRLAGQDARYRIHATPGYPRTVMVGITARLWGK